MDTNEYPKYRVLHYFESSDVILEAGLNTSMFHNDLLPYVDQFCEAFNNGTINPEKFQSGTNFYWEFMKYVELNGVKLKFKS